MELVPFQYIELNCCLWFFSQNFIFVASYKNVQILKIAKVHPPNEVKASSSSLNILLFGNVLLHAKVTHLHTFLHPCTFT